MDVKGKEVGPEEEMSVDSPTKLLISARSSGLKEASAGKPSLSSPRRNWFCDQSCAFCMAGDGILDETVLGPEAIDSEVDDRKGT